jgi:hypothetical protein
VLRALISVALVVLQQVAQREARRQLVANAILISVSALALIVGGSFLIAAGFMALEEVYGATVAAAVVGGLLCAVAAIVLFAVSRRRPRRTVQLPSLAPAAIIPAAAVAGDRRVQAIFDEFRRILDAGGSLAAAFFFIGISAGLIARWLNRRRV